mgnify:FL=1|jgi:hypothetical protein
MMNKTKNKQPMIYERNPNTGEIRARVVGEYDKTYIIGKVKDVIKSERQRNT